MIVVVVVVVVATVVVSSLLIPPLCVSPQSNAAAHFLLVSYDFWPLSYTSLSLSLSLIVQGSFAPTLHSTVHKRATHTHAHFAPGDVSVSVKQARERNSLCSVQRPAVHFFFFAVFFCHFPRAVYGDFSCTNCVSVFL